MAGQLWAEHPGTWLQSHVSENRAEVAWIRELYPERRGYLDVYDHYKQLGPRSIYGHGIWLSEPELHRCHDTGTALAHCPTSNEFLGSGQFNLHNAIESIPPGARRAGHRPRRRHLVLAIADAQPGLQDRAAARQ